MQKSKDLENWADVLVNIKYKLFKTKLLESGKLYLNLFKQHKNLILYFEEVKQAEVVFNIIQENKTMVLLKELSAFSDRLQTLKLALN